MYVNGMRAISRVLNVPLGTVFTWIKRYGRKKYEKLAELWGKAKDLVKGGVVSKVVDEMWTYLYKNTRAFYNWAFSNKPFGQTSSIVLAKIATWVLSTHVAIRGRDSPI